MSAEKDIQSRYKQYAAEHAVSFVRPGMAVGLGSGSTAIFATRRIGALHREGELPGIVAISTSRATEAEARRLGIPLLPDDLPQELDLTIDGADEVDPELNLIKGGGGALLREKIVAQASRRVVIVADENKPSPRLGSRFVVPVEVVPFAWGSQARYLETLGARTVLRRSAEDAPFLTDQGNYILDCNFGPIADAVALAALLKGRAGIVEHGLFIGLATDLIVAGAGGIRHLVAEAEGHQHMARYA